MLALLITHSFLESCKMIFSQNSLFPSPADVWSSELLTMKTGKYRRRLHVNGLSWEEGQGGLFVLLMLVEIQF